MTIKGATGGRGTRAISKRYPAEDGIIGATTKQTGHKMQLEPQSSNVSRRLGKGIE